MTGSELLEHGIKAVIQDHPGVAAILESYQIGCVPCQLGTCKLKDVVEIHNLSESVEAEMFRRIAETVFPGQQVAIPRIERKARESRANFSPPVKMLVDEHVLIKRLLALVPSIVARVRLPEDRQDILDAVEFIRQFADRFHHAKEEELLFPRFAADQAIIQVMLADHATGRALVGGLVAALEAGDRETVAGNLSAYRDLLAEHIKKEDEILFPWMDRGLETSQVGRLFTEFRETDGRYPEAWERHTRIIETLERKYADG